MIAPARARRPGAETRRQGVGGRCRGLPLLRRAGIGHPSGDFRHRPARPARGRAGLVGAGLPNKSPAFGPWSDEGDKGGLFARRAARGRQEVVVHSPRHVRTFSDLTGREVEQVADACRTGPRRRTSRASRTSRRSSTRAEPPEPASRTATRSSSGWRRSRRWWPRNGPRRRPKEAASWPCPRREPEQRIRIVDERDGLLLLCPFAGRQPYEMMIAPRSARRIPSRARNSLPPYASFPRGSAGSCRRRPSPAERVAACLRALAPGGRAAAFRSRRARARRGLP